MDKKFTILIKTLTPIWTGDVNGRCSEIKETGIIGSLRWWYEVMVRGMNGYACDPTAEERCILDERLHKKNPDGAVQRICPACQLFGCTGWSRKFRLEISTDGYFKDGFNGEMELKIIELKEITEAEKWLLKIIFEIIGKYGSIAGRTTRKPQKNMKVGSDFGIIKIKSIDIESFVSKQDVENWLTTARFRDNSPDWPDFRYFFFVKNKFLWRKQINELTGLSTKGKPVDGENYQQFLRGKIGESKKIFSFKTDGGRIWGYAKNEQMLDEIEKKLKNTLQIDSIIKGNEVLKNEL